MTRNKKIVKPNITYQQTYVGTQQNFSSVITSSQMVSQRIKQTNLQAAKMALSKLNNPKLSNLEKAKKALDESKSVIFHSTPSEKNPFYDKWNENLFKDMDFKVTANQGKDFEKAKLMTELIKYVISGGSLQKNYDKNTNKGGNS